MRGIINKNIDYIETFQESEPKELSKDEVAELVRIVKKEISGRFEPTLRWAQGCGTIFDLDFRLNHSSNQRELFLYLNEIYCPS
ncbi:MAG: hypothetical protein WCF07_12250 [Nitrososphaeraceae archaeon]